MRSKVLESQVRSGQLSSGHVWAVSGPLASASVEVRGTQRHSRRSPPPRNGGPQHLIEAAIQGLLDQMIFFSAPLTTRAPPGRPAERPAGRPQRR